MAVIIGLFIGAAIVLHLLSALFEWALFKRVMDDPVAGKATSLFAAWVLVSLLIASGALILRTSAILVFGLTALILLPFWMRSGFKARQRMREKDELVTDLEETFS
jgi:hypothetical protein